ncbi:phosphatidylserine/phosphatidylglycerophosphate/cardiolipin synthase family protein [Dactylosporangium vinaceum]|nr:phosphatidylserine/phosphatidylglycerophosphate/cardiolipin synthase family protein [Dactylosporangium vinaceum]
MFERVVRTGRAIGLRIDAVLATVLAAELVAPSSHLWLVSPWISDVPVLDNTSGSFDSVFVDPSNRMYTLSEVLALLTNNDARLSVVARPDPHNNPFLERLRRSANGANLQIQEHGDVHEKTLCGDEWLLTGSMNMTLRGMQINDEAMTYKVSTEAAAAARLDFRHRFGGFA